MNAKSILTVAICTVLAMAAIAQAAPVGPGDADTFFLYNADVLTGDSTRYGCFRGMGETTANEYFFNRSGTATQVAGPDASFANAASFNANHIQGHNDANLGNIVSNLQTFSFEMWLRVRSSDVDPQADHNGAYYSTAFAGFEEFKVNTTSNGAIQIMEYATELDDSGKTITTLTSGEDSIWDGQWHHVLATYDHTQAGTNAYLYVDGQLEDSGDAPLGWKFRDMDAQGWTSNIQVGHYNNSARFYGDIDQVRMFVPEPTTCGMLVLGAIGMIRRRRAG